MITRCLVDWVLAEERRFAAGLDSPCGSCAFAAHLDHASPHGRRLGRALSLLSSFTTLTGIHALATSFRVPTSGGRRPSAGAGGSTGSELSSDMAFVGRIHHPPNRTPQLTHYPAGSTFRPNRAARSTSVSSMTSCFVLIPSQTWFMRYSVCSVQRASVRPGAKVYRETGSRGGAGWAC